MFGLFKRKTVNIKNKEALSENLNHISELLYRNGFHIQAEAINKPLAFLRVNDTTNFLRTIKTVDIWGGSGAVWEVGGFSTIEQESEFQLYFIQLAKLLKESGVKFRTSDRIANIFKKDLKQNNK
jgi:hypothetical protein